MSLIRSMKGSIDVGLGLQTRQFFTYYFKGIYNTIRYVGCTWYLRTYEVVREVTLFPFFFPLIFFTETSDYANFRQYDINLGA